MKRILKYKWIIVTVLIVLAFSTMNVRVSRGFSHRIAFFLHLLFGRFDSNDISINNIEIFVRKFAHFIEYFMLYTIIFVGIREYIKKESLQFFLTLIVICLVALVDEGLVQKFIGVGRNSNIYDVIIDFSGGLLSMFNIFIMSVILKYKH